VKTVKYAALVAALAGCGDNLDRNPTDGGGSGSDAGTPTETLQLANLDGPVDVSFDDRAIPHIYAKTVHDLLLAEGYLMAKDRFGQMEFIRRGVLGSLAEIAGGLMPNLIAQDQQSRFLGFQREGKAIYDGLAPDSTSKKGADAFVDGVNQWLDANILQVANYHAPTGLEALALFKNNLSHWKPEDVFALARYQAWNLSYDADSDIARTQARQGALTAFPALSVDPKLAARQGVYEDMFTDKPARADFTTGPSAALRQAKNTSRPPVAPVMSASARTALDGAGAYFDAFSGGMFRRDPHIGSNSWVVSGDATASGNPILSNDPHLSLIAPGVWWYVHLNTAAMNGERMIDTEGVAFAGLPGVVLGFNEKVAWSATTAGYDVTDVYSEQVTFQNTGTTAIPVWVPISVKFNGGDVAITHIDESIVVQGQATPTVLRLYVVPHHGVIIPTSITPPASGNLTSGSALSVRYTGQDDSDELSFFNGLWDAKDFADVDAAQTNFKVGAQNFSAVSKTDGIRWSSSARVPTRVAAACTFTYDAGGVPQGTSPQFVLVGDGSMEWNGDLPTVMVPHDANPARKYIATANQDNIGNTADGNPCNDATYLGGDFDVGYREHRIREKLDAAVAAGGITPQQMSELQAETKSSIGEKTRDSFVAALNHALGDTSDDAVLAAAVGTLDANQKAILTDARDRLMAWTFATPHGVGATDAAEVSDSVATTVFNVMLSRLVPLTIGDETSRIGRAPGTLQATRLIEWMLTDPTHLATYRTIYSTNLTYNQSVLWDDLGTDTVLETKDERIVRAVLAAYGYLGTRLGNDRTQWRWGRLHTVRFDQIVPDVVGGGNVVSIPPVGDATFPDGFPRHGDLAAVDVGNFDIYNTTNFMHSSGASQRLVVEMSADGPTAYNALPGGQVETPDSPHHADEAELWRQNKAPQIWFKKSDIDAHTASKLTITPKP
jgi:penicillin amidase